MWEGMVAEAGAGSGCGSLLSAAGEEEHTLLGEGKTGTMLPGLHDHAGAEKIKPQLACRQPATKKSIRIMTWP